MIYNNMDFHNVAEIDTDEEGKGLRPRRYPSQIRYRLELDGKNQAASCKGCEVRFVTDAENIKVSISTADCQGDIIVYKGDYFHSIHRLNENELTDIDLMAPKRFKWVEKEALIQTRFSSKVWRIILDVQEINNIVIDTFGHSVRPPEKEETPLKRWLAYGSSVTYGVGAVNNHNSYVQQAAMRLKVDVFNLGLSGCCFCEKEVADFIAERGDWDFVTLEIGVNMRGVKTEVQFRDRAEYLIDKILELNPLKPVIVISILPNHAIYTKIGSIYKEPQISFNRILKELVEKKNNPNLHIILGEDILQNFTGLTVDLIHPSDSGHILMGENLTRVLRDIV